MPVYAIVTSVNFPPYEPLPAGRIAAVKRGVPAVVPTQHIGIFVETVREILHAETIINGRVGHVRLGDKLIARMKVLFLLPVHRNLGFGHCTLLFLAHLRAPILIFKPIL